MGLVGRVLHPWQQGGGLHTFFGTQHPRSSGGVRVTRKFSFAATKPEQSSHFLAPTMYSRGPAAVGVVYRLVYV